MFLAHHFDTIGFTRVESSLRTMAMGGLKIYPGAAHGFYGDERPSYQAEAARDAWGQPLSWLQTFLQA